MAGKQRKKKGTAGNIANRLFGAVLLALICAFLVWLTTRSMTIVMRNGGLNADGITALISKFSTSVAKKPFFIDWSFMEVKACAVLSVGVPLAYAIAYLSKGMKLKNEDTENAHGGARFATKAEAAELLDKKNFCNNLYYGEGCGIVFEGHDKKTKAAGQGINLNCITLGISGLGKTYNLVAYDLMQSVGSALDPEPYGIRNIPAHLAASPVGKVVKFLPEATRIMSGKDEEAPVEDTDFNGEVLPPVPDEPAEETASVEAEGAVAEDGASKEGEGGEACKKNEQEKRQGVFSKRVSRVRESYIAQNGERKAQRSVKIGGGFDVVNTDPKGDNVRDFGWLFEAAGYDVKVVNTIDFEQGLKFNPLAYIKTQYVDLVPPEEVEVGFATRVVSREGEVEEYTAQEPLSTTHAVETRKTLHRAYASLSIDTDTFTLGDVPRTNLTIEELDEKLQDKGLDPEQRDMLLRQRAVLSLDDIGSFSDESGVLQAGNGCSKVAEAVSDFKYRHSTGEILVSFVWNPEFPPQEAKVVVEIPECLIIDSILQGRGKFEWPVDDNGNVCSGPVVWDLSGLVHAADPDTGELVYDQMLIKFHIKPFRVADGVDLTKTVDCLVVNLRGTAAGENGSEDPFWEDTKRLCLMSLVAFLFERYPDPKYHTIPHMMRLLNMAMSEDGDPAAPSQLDVLMDQHERAEIYMSGDATSTDGYRGARRGGKWVKTDNDKHSRDNSMALHCYHAFKSGAPETVQSVIISCHAALTNLISADVKEFLSKDELKLDTLGDPGQKQIIFVVTKDTNSPFDFITALITYLAIDLAQDKAFKKYGGKLPRHVRFVLDEVANIGKIPILIRALAVVRSRNISISMFLQSKAQLSAVYGDKQADIILDNCSTIIYLGAQSKTTTDEMSEMLGEETVWSRTFQRNFGQTGTIGGSNESLNSTSRRLLTGSELRQLTKGTELVFIFNHKPALVKKNATYKHPLYSWVYPGERTWLQPMAHHTERFDFKEYCKRMEEKREAESAVDAG